MSSVNNTFGQPSKFQKLADKLFFNIFAHKPDSTVFDFVQKYYPAYTEKFEPGGWVIYPPGPIPKLYYTIHSLRFQKHPYFDAAFHEGRLDILSSEEQGGKPGVSDFQLWFMFDTKKDADAAFSLLQKMFEKVSKQKKVVEINGRKIAQFTDQDKMDAFNSMEFILTKHELYDGKYKMLFRWGAFTYKEKNGA